MSTDNAGEVRLERARRSLCGLAVGDAFGGTFFWKTDAPDRIRARELPSELWRWSDDTAMGRCVVACLKQHQAIVSETLARVLAEEYTREPTRGYGTMAHTVLDEIGQGVPWRQAAGNLYDGMGSCGNGAAMRAGPVGAYFAGDIERVLAEARRSAVVTHAHPEGQVGAQAVAAAAAWAAVASEAGLDGQAMLAWVHSHLEESVTRSNLERALTIPFEATPEQAAALLGSGQKVTAQDTVPFALWCAARHLDNYAEALWATVSGLGDMDTTCAIVGSIVVLCAPVGIPSDWQDRTEPVSESPRLESTPLQSPSLESPLDLGAEPESPPPPPPRQDSPPRTTWAPYAYPMWDGYVRSSSMANKDWVARRHRLFDAAEKGDWSSLFQLLPDSRERTLDFVRPDDPNLFTFLHHAVRGEAPQEVVEHLVAKGHSRSLRCAAGERPLDLARRLGRDRLVPLLEPSNRHAIDDKTSQALENHFHRLIVESGVAARVNASDLRLPQLELLKELEEPMMIYLVPGMFGGFQYRLLQVSFPFDRPRWVLLTRSFCRILDGEELHRHIITPLGYVMMTQGCDDDE